jgi:hypothetical protein
VLAVSPGLCACVYVCVCVCVRACAWSRFLTSPFRGLSLPFRPGRPVCLGPEVIFSFRSAPISFGPPKLVRRIPPHSYLFAPLIAISSSPFQLLPSHHLAPSHSSSSVSASPPLAGISAISSPHLPSPAMLTFHHLLPPTPDRLPRFPLPPLVPLPSSPVFMFPSPSPPHPRHSPPPPLSAHPHLSSGPPLFLLRLPQPPHSSSPTAWPSVCPCRNFPIPSPLAAAAATLSSTSQHLPPPLPFPLQNP